MKKSLIIALAVVLSHNTFGFEILSKDLQISENNNVWTTRSVVTIKGNYQEYVDRAVDITKYPMLGVPFFKRSLVVSGSATNRILWINTYIFPRNSYFYLRNKVNRGPTATTSQFSLLPKSGPHPSEHRAEILNGNATIKVLEGTGDDTTFQVRSETRFKLKGDIAIPQGLMKRGLRYYNDGTLKALTQ